MRGADLSKRVFDFLCGSLGVILLSPVLAVIALLVKLTSPGPVFYRGERIGRDGTAFRIVKFRSMVPNAEVLGGSATANDDSRITPVGQVLRKYKLDELPQLLNVVRGEMSLVGPRPEVRKYVDMGSAEQRRILSLRPGITDWATIWNADEGSVLAGSNDPERTYEELILPTKLRLQLHYLEHRSFAVDLKIIVHTMIRMVDKTWVPRDLAEYGSAVSATVKRHWSV
jgi:lipopolysaccharide/colanic/teichoic acid biosynthesis glycosyltransferase